jgi:hypothetical protein
LPTGAVVFPVAPEDVEILVFEGFGDKNWVVDEPVLDELGVVEPAGVDVSLLVEELLEVGTEVLAELGVVMLERAPVSVV